MDSASLDRHITGNYGEDQLSDDTAQDEAYARTMVASINADPTMHIGPCGHFTCIHSAYYPLCSNCGFKATYLANS